VENDDGTNRKPARLNRPAEEKALLPIQRKQSKAKKKCGPWKSGNPKSGFPLSHRPKIACGARKERPFTQNT
jgi:hypothetical protein